MSFKVLVADDSTNIQKVVKIIYEEKGYEIIECLDASDLSSKLSLGPDLVLLDFGLSDDKEGYDLAKEIKDANECKVILLFGTFDTIDEEKIKELNIDGYLFKPFDSDKLLSVSDEILGDETSKEEKTQTLNISDKDSTNVTKTVMNPVESEMTITKVVAPDEALGDETAWGVKIPNIIGEEDLSDSEPSVLNEDNQRIPEIIESDITKTVIGGVNSLEIENNIEEQEENVYPSEEDLEYPEEIGSEDKSAVTSTLDIDVERPDFDEIVASSSKLTPSQDLLADVPEEEDTNDATEIVEMDIAADGEQETLKKLKKQIFDELDDNLWSDDHSNTNILVGELGKKVVSEGANLPDRETKEDIIHELKQEIYTEIRNEVIESLKTELPSLLKNELIPYFEEHIKEYSKNAVEKGIWEILPELAEKVISRELEEIRESISDS